MKLLLYTKYGQRLALLRKKMKIELKLKELLLDGELLEYEKLEALHVRGHFL